VNIKIETTTKCIICNHSLLCRWTDTHGIGACIICGTCYKLYHYDENGKRLNKPAEHTYFEEWIPILKKYWNENHKLVDPGAFNFPGSSYEVAKQEDFIDWYNWLTAHKDELPKQEEGEENDIQKSNKG